MFNKETAVVHVADIEWDTKHCGKYLNPKDFGLPSTAEIPLKELLGEKEWEDNTLYELSVEDWLVNKYGFSVLSCMVLDII